MRQILMLPDTLKHMAQTLLNWTRSALDWLKLR